ncbi:MAG: hypothetical protein GY930_17995, partial [bacterium]|nr:hypothetical protein [bacterium]
MASEKIDKDTVRTGAPPIGFGGKYFKYRDGVFVGLDLQKLEKEVAEQFDGENFCSRKSDYSAIARHIYDIVEDPDFFNESPIGIAVKNQFWSLGDDGRIRR